MEAYENSIMLIWAWIFLGDEFNYDWDTDLELLKCKLILFKLHCRYLKLHFC